MSGGHPLCTRVNAIIVSLCRLSACMFHIKLFTIGSDANPPDFIGRLPNLRSIYEYLPNFTVVRLASLDWPYQEFYQYVIKIIRLFSILVFAVYTSISMQDAFVNFAVAGTIDQDHIHLLHLSVVRTCDKNVVSSDFVCVVIIL